jgi:hypothetical protein
MSRRLGSGRTCVSMLSVILFSSDKLESNACIPASGCEPGDVRISVHQRRYRRLLETIHLVLSASAVQQAGKLCIAVCKLVDLEHWRALDRSRNGFLEQSVGSTIVQSHLGYDGVTATRLPHDRDIVRVTSERSDVVFHPFEGEALVEQSSVGRGKVLVRHETESSEAVSNVHSDEILALTDPIAKVVVRGCAVLQTAALQREERCQSALKLDRWWWQQLT